MRNSVVAASLLLVAVAVVMNLNAVEAAQDAPAPTLSGMWGGDRIRLDGAASGARIQVDCLTASIDHAIRLDAAGTFTVALTFVPLRGVAPDGEEKRQASQVTGRVEKDTLRLTIGPADTEPAGTFTLERNKKATLPNCRMRG